MERKTLIFGNGLGMAVDQEHFCLKNAIAYIWDDERYLSAEEKRYILQCLPNATNRPPREEGELDLLHLAVIACSLLSTLSGNDVSWLSEHGKKFPGTIAKCIHKIATQLYLYSGQLPEGFADPLSDFIKKTHSHVATLNYDKLLYDALIERGVLTGYDGALVDGMVAGGFSYDNLKRKYSKDFGYYLHLHGSPLFIRNGDTYIKKPRSELTLDSAFIGRHLVLTHVDHKQSVIAASPVLSTYWEYFDSALQESTGIIIFGCSGADVHLNRRLRYYAKHQHVKIVEWDGAGDQASRQHFWNNQLETDIELVQLPNILEFKDW